MQRRINENIVELIKYHEQNLVMNRFCNILLLIGF